MAILNKESQTGYRSSMMGERDAELREKWIRVLLTLFIMVATIAVLIFGFIFVRQQLLSHNRRFELREVVVKSSGYWQGKEAQLAERLGIAPGMNLFAIKPTVIRKKLLMIPGVSNCEVVRVLPDTLHLRVIERIPRAVLGNLRGRWVVDDNGVVIPRLECMNPTQPRPVINGLKIDNIQSGMKLESLEPALELIMLTARSFPDISIIAISMSNPSKLEFFMRYRNQKNCRVIFPLRSRNYAFLLSTLQSAIIHAGRRGDTHSSFDLSFDGRVIIR